MSELKPKRTRLSPSDRALFEQAEHAARLEFAGPSVRFVLSVRAQAEVTGRITDGQRVILERIAAGKVWRRYESPEKASWTRRKLG